jgi:hypothetical protein
MKSVCIESEHLCTCSKEVIPSEQEIKHSDSRVLHTGLYLERCTASDVPKCQAAWCSTQFCSGGTQFESLQFLASLPEVFCEFLQSCQVDAGIVFCNRP